MKRLALFAAAMLVGNELGQRLGEWAAPRLDRKRLWNRG